METIDFSDVEPESPPQTLGYPTKLVEGVERAHRILLAHGAVGQGKPCVTWQKARWRADRLKDLLVKFGDFEHHELKRRVWPVEGGFRWAVELAGGRTNGRADTDA